MEGTSTDRFAQGQQWDDGKDLPNVKVRYELTVYCDEEEVYHSNFASDESLQEEGLRKADHSIDAFREQIAEEMLDKELNPQDYI